ncbi:DUF1775 domain-containing protein [Phenylobacterium aquaticum]|uniref:DUF1775 domain-containing protein n=1 Tax=Phenylobacterium aquaticum TaxID=1763816 RepID=UPI001F5CCF2D|nr:DUF1775 domain-containing protein [Phenylobacterium aquaticum]MCI3130911.1 DUF1775 domain-containing protein [Phenylobacterium aquaticum]
MYRFTALALPLALLPGMAQAHVTVSPGESTPGKAETYTFNVPTEGKSPTTAVELDVPPEMTIISVRGPESGYTLTKSADRIVGITWRVNIPPGGGQQLVLVARNPTEPSFGVQWKVHQRFADGTSADWVDPPPARPAPRTRILPK